MISYLFDAVVYEHIKSIFNKTRPCELILYCSMEQETKHEILIPYMHSNLTMLLSVTAAKMFTNEIYKVTHKKPPDLLYECIGCLSAPFGLTYEEVITLEKEINKLRGTYQFIANTVMMARRAPITALNSFALRYNTTFNVEYDQNYIYHLIFLEWCKSVKINACSLIKYGSSTELSVILDDLYSRDTSLAELYDKVPHIYS